MARGLRLSRGMVPAIADRKERIAALERLIAVERRLFLDQRYEVPAGRIILEAERELRRLKGH